jgi:hypothetical protein
MFWLQNHCGGWFHKWYDIQRYTCMSYADSGWNTACHSVLSSKKELGLEMIFVVFRFFFSFSLLFHVNDELMNVGMNEFYLFFYFFSPKQLFSLCNEWMIDFPKFVSNLMIEWMYECMHEWMNVGANKGMNGVVPKITHKTKFLNLSCVFFISISFSLGYFRQFKGHVSKP